MEYGPELVGYDYDCAANYLTDLKGSPRKIGYVFDCRDNKLTTLEGSPDYIDGSFQCSYNNLTDLKNGPDEITGHLICSGNQINSLEFYPKVDKTFELHGNPIGSLFDSFDPDLDVIKAFNSYRVLKDGVVIIISSYFFRLIISGAVQIFSWRTFPIRRFFYLKVSIFFGVTSRVFCVNFVFR